MKCSFCQHELTAAMVREQGCGTCPGGCRKIHCPYCGQENDVVPERLEKLLQRDTSQPEKGKPS